MSDSSRIISLRACMVKEDYINEDFNFFISEEVEVQKYKVEGIENVDSIVWIKKTVEKRPQWARIIDELTGKHVDELRSISSSAAVFLRVPEKGLIIFLFGYGRFLINQSYIQADFGIKTALNCLDHSTLRSIDSLSLDEQPIQKRIQTSRETTINAFGLDVSRDILRSVTGTPRSGVKFQSIAGSDSFLGFSKSIELKELSSVAEELVDFYNEDVYKENFEWIDNIKRIKKDEVLEILNQKLFTQICNNDSENIYLTIPEIISWDKIYGYSFTRLKNEIHPTINIKDYYKTIKDEYNFEIYKRDKVFLIDHQNQNTSYPIYKCIYTELEESDKKYIYFNGEWFEIDKDFVTRINIAISKIKISEIIFPSVKKTNKIIDGRNKVFLENEGDYNQRACKELGFHCLDKKLIKTKMASSSIEICDMLSSNKKVIHVKSNKGGSSSLSHLFSQGFISAETLLSDREFRKSARKKLKEISSDLDLIPLDSYKSSDYEIIFLIMGADSNIKEKLPFFSKVNFHRIFKELSQRGYSISLASAPLE